MTPQTLYVTNFIKGYYVMQKEKFITVMAIFDDDVQAGLQNIAEEFGKRYGTDTKTKGI